MAAVGMDQTPCDCMLYLVVVGLFAAKRWYISLQGRNDGAFEEQE